jgi:hypothetical protein
VTQGSSSGAAKPQRHCRSQLPTSAKASPSPVWGSASTAFPLWPVVLLKISIIFPIVSMCLHLIKQKRAVKLENRAERLLWYTVYALTPLMALTRETTAEKGHSV